MQKYIRFPLYNVLQECLACLNIVNLFLELVFYDATVKKSEKQQEICVTCISISPVFENTNPEGCSVKLQNDIHTFVFNITRHNNNSLVLLECFSVEEAGEYSVHVYEIQNGEIIEYTSQKLDNIVISESEFVCCELIIIHIFSRPIIDRCRCGKCGWRNMWVMSIH